MSVTELEHSTSLESAAGITARPKVRSLGYVVVEATNLDAWVAFASDLLGLQLSVRTDDRLEFRMDEKEYRLIINKGETDGARVIGWEVSGPKDLAQLSQILTEAGYEVTQMNAEEVRERRVTAGARFDDPDKLLTLELHYGLREATDRLVTPHGNRFITGRGGLGHVFQAVKNWDAYNTLYFDLLGFSLSDHIEGGPNGEIDLTFLHCNERHHSYAFAELPNVGSAVGHLMFEVDELDVVGRAWEKVLEEDAAPILSTLGKHTNDKMISFYVRSPSNFGIEYGTGGIVIDEKTWTPTRYSAAHYWGHNRKTPVDPTDAADNS
ncbi:VOC family protein [Glutamicibacter uratoxydans]|uniref:VOC family protein n=1 Tax=Glutamicibacter uratoxydans TaxID=43667 RepID=UPI003D6ECC0D